MWISVRAMTGDAVMRNCINAPVATTRPSLRVDTPTSRHAERRGDGGTRGVDVRRSGQADGPLPQERGVVARKRVRCRPGAGPLPPAAGLFGWGRGQDVESGQDVDQGVPDAEGEGDGDVESDGVALGDGAAARVTVSVTVLPTGTLVPAPGSVA
jgi:hypothetical protein